jgi:hypothetical protein
MTDQPLVNEQSHPPIIDLHRLATRTALWLGLRLVSWAERATTRRRAAKLTANARSLDALALERQLDQLQLDRTKWLVHFRQGL